MTDKAALDGLVTLTGENLIGALNALDEKLPDGAYKQVSLGGRKFTDISPAYTLEAISGHFGPLGVGWGYSVTDEHESDAHTSDGSIYAVIVLRVALWYVYLDGAEQRRVEWETYGGNANAGSKADRHFSWQGALTNAIGKGWSMQGFQRTIYKGEDFGMEDGDKGAAKQTKQQPKQKTGAIGDAPIVRAIYGKKKALGMSDSVLTAALKRDYGVEHPGDLTMTQAKELADKMQAAIDKPAEEPPGEFVPPADDAPEIAF